jgi:multicomponent Na+:H+ antiporter subunit E
LSFFLTAIIMFIFWILLSGEFSLVLLISAVVSSLFVAAISHDLLIGKTNIKSGTARLFRFIKYIPWLIWQVILANLDLVYRTLHPSMPIDPQIIEFGTSLESDIGIAILANSITLTPGTVTVVAHKNGKFIVHAIATGPAEGLLAGDMQERVKKIEGD